MLKKKISSSVTLALSMAIFGTIGLFVRYIPLPSGEIALYRAALASLMISLYFLFSKRKISLSSVKKEALLLLISGGALGLNWMLLFEAYKHTTVSVATLSYYFAPVIVTALCPFVFKERMTKKQIICFVMSTLGLVLITGIAGGGGDDILGILFGLGAAMLYATVILLNKFIKTVEAIERTLLQFLSATAVLIPYVILTDGFNLVSLDRRGIINLVIVGLIHTGVTYCMYFFAIKDLPGQRVSILSYIDPLVAVLISVTFLGEKMSLWQIVGGVLILGFTLLNEIKIKRSSHDEEGI